MLNKLQDYIVPDLELAYTIARKRADFDTYYKFQKWAIEYIKANVRGRMSTRHAQQHIDWIEFYIVPRPHLYIPKYTRIEESDL